MSSEEPLSLEALLKAAGDELAYLNAPVEGRLTRKSYVRLKELLEPDPAKPQPPPTPFAVATGIRVIVDETMPPNRIEFRDREGNVTASIELP